MVGHDTNNEILLAPCRIHIGRIDQVAWNGKVVRQLDRDLTNTTESILVPLVQGRARHEDVGESIVCVEGIWNSVVRLVECNPVGNMLSIANHDVFGVVQVICGEVLVQIDCCWRIHVD